MIRLKDKKTVFLVCLLLNLFFMVSCTDTDYNRLAENAEISFMATVNEMNEPAKNDTGTVSSGYALPTCELIDAQTDSLWLITSEHESFDTEVATKGTPVTDMYSAFKMYGYTFDGNWNEAVTPDLMFGETLTKSGSIWKPAMNSYWQGKGKNVRFFAYAPVNQNGLTAINPATQVSAGSPVFAFTLPSSVADQQDLLVSRTVDLADNTNACQQLTFNHALTAVKFKAAANMPKSTVTKITLKGVYGAAKFSYATMSWSELSAAKDFSQVVSIPITGAGDITQPAQTFMMIPQTLPAGASIEVVITENISGFTRTLTAPIAGKVWSMGKMVTYTVSSSALTLTPTFTITAPSAAYSYAGGTQNFTVSSYATNMLGEKFPVKWQTEFSIDGGVSWTTTRPAWLSAFTASGNGNISTGETMPATLAAQTKTVQTNDQLLNQTPVTNYDLSTQGGTTTQNTANCYIVNGPGSYRFPLVFGNAIKNGATNSAAYNGNNFVAGSGNLIHDPWLKNNVGSTPSSATLIWQDASNLVSDVKLVGDEIHFTISQSTIKPGNAIVAIRSSDNYIRWSWHIWVTPWKGETFTVNGREMMTLNLGWVDKGSWSKYEPRQLKVRFKQEGFDGFKEIVLNQSGYLTGSEAGYSPYYQWGRKDPLYLAAGDGTNNPAQVTGPFAPTKFNNEGANTLGKVWGIIQPYVFYQRAPFVVGQNNNWCGDMNQNDWGFTSNIKTIYDPSPVGFVIPNKEIYNGLTRSGTFNSGQSLGNTGGPSTFFRALGVIHPNTGAYGSQGTIAQFASKNFPGTDNYYCIGFKFDATTYDSNFSRPTGSGVSVRSIRE